MPDFNTVTYARCSNLSKTPEVAGSKGKVYFVSNPRYAPDWQCTCPSFKFKKADKFGAKPYCKHIKMVLAKCTWDQFLDAGEPTEDDKCPCCGEPVEYYRAAV